jgi:hypothetical protein
MRFCCFLLAYGECFLLLLLWCLGEMVRALFLRNGSLFDNLGLCCYRLVFATLNQVEFFVIRCDAVRLDEMR